MEVTFVVGMFIAVFMFVYFLPTVIAMARDHHNLGAIFMTNLLLGWSAIGWVVAMIWSMTSNTRGSRNE